MASTIIPPPVFDITVRVGCSLAYNATGTASLLLKLKPRANRNHAVVFEALTLGDNLPAEEFKDSHGNAVWRVSLARGRIACATTPLSRSRRGPTTTTW
jgi:hypothetical protein